MSEEKAHFERHPRDSKDQLADALASMGGVSETSATPRRSEAEPRDPAAEAQLPDASDDATIAPPPQLSSFVKKRPVRTGALDRAIFLRRTTIPVLLTLGVLLPAVASLKWLSAPESPFATWPKTAVWLLIVVGKLMLLTAIATMAQVKHMMQQRARHAV